MPNYSLKLYNLRIKYNLTQIEFAKILNIKQRTYSNIEKNKSKIDINILRKLNENFDIDINDFILSENYYI